MRNLGISAIGLLATAFLASARADPPRTLELADGDRVVYLGNTFAERDAKYGYLETLLTADNPDKAIQFRNLGWSGDTVWGDARGRFGGRAEGFQHLKEHVLALKPTVILVAYGMNESFAGEAGLAEFEKGLETLLDTLAETKARIVLISPIPQEPLRPTPRLPNQVEQDSDKYATTHNRDLEKYVSVLTKVAKGRDLVHVDLFNTRVPRSIGSGGSMGLPLTDDGIHPNEAGYKFLAREIHQTFRKTPNLSYAASPWSLTLAGSEVKESTCVDVSEVSAGEQGVRFRAVIRRHALPDGLVTSDRLKPGRRYRLRIDGVETRPVSRLGADGATMEAKDSANGAATCSFLADRAVAEYAKRDEELREAINRKNELYFYRWRPQNETYLFGFRKHEQGNNGREIPLFDPLVAEKEAEIARLKKPIAHTYELILEDAPK